MKADCKEVSGKCLGACHGAPCRALTVTIPQWQDSDTFEPDKVVVSSKLV